MNCWNRLIFPLTVIVLAPFRGRQIGSSHLRWQTVFSGLYDSYCCNIDIKSFIFFPETRFKLGADVGWRLISVDAVLFEQSQSGPSIYQPSCTQPHTPPATWDCCAVLWLAAAEFTHILPWCTANSGPQGRAGKHLLRPAEKTTALSSCGTAVSTPRQVGRDRAGTANT